MYKAFSSTLFLSLALLLAAAPGHAGIVYSNTLSETVYVDPFLDNGLVAGGDEIALAAGPRYLQAITASLFNLDTVDADADVTLNLYHVNAGDTAGSLF